MTENIFIATEAQTMRHQWLSFEGATFVKFGQLNRFSSAKYCAPRLTLPIQLSDSDYNFLICRLSFLNANASIHIIMENLLQRWTLEIPIGSHQKVHYDLQ